MNRAQPTIHVIRPIGRSCEKIGSALSIGGREHRVSLIHTRWCRMPREFRLTVETALTYLTHQPSNAEGVHYFQPGVASTLGVVHEKYFLTPKALAKLVVTSPPPSEVVCAHNFSWGCNNPRLEVVNAFGV